MTRHDVNQLIHDGHLELQILVHKPVTIVWNRFIHMHTWVTSHVIEQVQGEPGEIGAVIRASFKQAAELGMPLPHYHFCKTIKVVIGSQYLFKTYSEKCGSYGLSIIGFDDARFESLGNDTRLTFNFYGEYSGEYLAKEPSDGDHMLKNLQNLKSLVEQPIDNG